MLAAVATLQPHQRLMNQAAREALKPLGIRQQGRSRIWLDDNGWWIGLIYFKPSGFAKVSDLEIWCRWAWDIQNRHVLGTRVTSTISRESDAWYVSYENDEQFAPLITEQMTLAVDHVLRLRELLTTPQAAAVATETWDIRLGPRPKPPDREKRAMAGYAEYIKGYPPSSDLLNHGVLLGLVGRREEAADIFDRHLTLTDREEDRELDMSKAWNRERVEWRRYKYDWIHDLRSLLEEPARFADEVRKAVAQGRARLGFVPEVPLPF
jgi:hypothetical protein